MEILVWVRPNSKKSYQDTIPKTIHSPENAIFIQMLREAREKAGLTQVEASQKLGVRQNMISDIERGERRVDMMEFLYFCKGYGVNPVTFLGRLCKALSKLGATPENG